MNNGAITQYIDVAQIVLYAFWIFFAGLIIYLRREDKREGYPLESDRSERSPRVQVQGFPRIPKPKRLILAHGGEVSVPREVEQAQVMVYPTAPWPGAPFAAASNPMQEAVGPAAFAHRADLPDLTLEGHPRLVPMRADQQFTVASEDIDPRGLPVFGGDGLQGGVVHDLWIDRSEPQIRYLEVTSASGRQVLVPIGFVRFDTWRRRAVVRSIFSTQFSGVPSHASPEQVTLLEEDQISAYYAGGTLYADPARAEPFL